MTQVRVREHLACNVETGYFPQRGVGFQTVAVAEELVGTEDLALLEELAPYYQASAHDRDTGETPVRESLFRLPSGRLAVSRTVDWGTDPHGRAGNYLAHTLVLEAGALPEHWDPFNLLDRAGAGKPDTELTPRAISPREIKLDNVRPDESALHGAPEPLLAGLLHQVITGANPVLILAPASQAREAIRTLRCCVPAKERPQLTFSTHFYRACHPLRARFRLMTARSFFEAPEERDLYAWFDLPEASVGGVGAGAAPSSYSRYAAARLKQGEGEALRTTIARIDRARDRRGTGEEAPLTDPDEALALWELAGEPAVTHLLAASGILPPLLRDGAHTRALADALLGAGSPAHFRGRSEEEGSELLRLLGDAASPHTWREWRSRWAGDPRVAAMRQPWWAFWR